MISEQARRFWSALAVAPKQIELPVQDRRAAGERAEDATAEPAGARFDDAPEVGGLWASSGDGERGAAILYLFGGGFMLGSPASRRKTAGHLAVASGVRVLVPNYRLAPEYPFPAALDDTLGAYAWLRRQLGPTARIVLAGDSAGGGLALSAAVAIRDRGLPPPVGVVTLSLWGDLTCGGASMEERAASDLACTRAALLEMGRWYVPDADPAQPLASPVFADLSSLPPLLCVVGGDEVLLDDTVRAVRRAGMAGVDATAFIAAGMQHVFPIWAGAFPEADAAVALVGEWIRRHVQRCVGP